MEDHDRRHDHHVQTVDVVSAVRSGGHYGVLFGRPQWISDYSPALTQVEPKLAPIVVRSYAIHPLVHRSAGDRSMVPINAMWPC